MSNSPSSTQIGDILKDKYRIDRLIDIGGMGEVYEATNIAINRHVAIKVLRHEFGEDSSIVGRFLQEAKTANVVQNKHIVQVFDIDTTESGLPFIVQELLTGETLYDRVHRSDTKRIPANALIEMLLPAIRALGEAHAQGVVHRDIKPSNIYLADEDDSVVVKILDFGISKFGDAKPNDDSRLTKASIMLGSPAYMSPEQIYAPRDVSAASDVWSVGVMLYELLSGQLPFDGGGQDSAVLVKVCTEDPLPIDEIAPETPAELVRIINRCLRKQPTRRYRSCKSLSSALAQINTVDARANADTFHPPFTPHPHEFTPPNPRNSTLVDSIPRPVQAAPTPTPAPIKIQLKRRSSAHKLQASSSSDLTSIFKAAIIMVAVSILALHFTSLDTLDKFSTKDTSFTTSLIVIAIAAICGRQIRAYMPQYSSLGINIASFGLFGISAAFMIFASAAIMEKYSNLHFASLFLAGCVSFAALGFCISGFSAAKTDLYGKTKHKLPGAFALILGIFSGAISVQFVTRIVQNI